MLSKFPLFYDLDILSIDLMFKNTHKFLLDSMKKLQFQKSYFHSTVCLLGWGFNIFFFSLVVWFQFVCYINIFMKGTIKRLLRDIKRLT